MAQCKMARQCEFEQKVIEFVKLHPAIWKKTDPNHANAIFIGNNWDYILDQLKPTEFAKTGKDVARIWKNVWSQYLAYKRKSKGSTGKRGGKMPNYRHSESMRFCEDPEEFETMNYSNADTCNDDQRDEDQAGTSNSSNSEEGSQVVVTVTNIEPPKKSHGIAGHSAKKAKLDPFAEHLLEVVKGHELDQFQHFCSATAIKMKAIAEVDKKRACRLQHDIQQLLFEAEMDILL